LQVKGRLNVGSGTNEDIYFEDSGVRMYDRYAPGHYRISFYKSNDFFTFEKSGAATSILWALDTLQLVPGGNPPFNFYGTGQLALPVLSAAPTSNNINGEIAAGSSEGANVGLGAR